MVGDNVQKIPLTGAWAAYLGLAYNLYLLAHNAKIQKSLIERLKNRDQFPGAYYETYVAAAFIKAGFGLEFENEADGSKSHCEFTASYRKTSAKFSVEAKARLAGKLHADVGNQLCKALAKEANHTRVIFIDVNMPDGTGHQDSMAYLNEALGSIRSREGSLNVHCEPAPPAYVIVTNHSYQYNLETSNFRRSALAEGFKIPEFKVDAEFPNIRAVLKAREKHYEMLMLMDSVRDHYEIPATFDGEMPEFAFGEVVPRLLIGQTYLLPTGGQETVGELTAAFVDEDKKLICGAYRLQDGRSIIATHPMTNDEVSAYHSHPDTFFGVVQKQTGNISNYLEFFDFLYDTYGHAQKSKLLDWMKNHKDYEVLKEQTQEELAITFCERYVYSWMKTHNTQ